MKKQSFIHLHNHSEYSLLDGAISINNLVALAEKYEMPAVALTDHGNMFGAVDFHEKAWKRGIKPILGCEVYVAKGLMSQKSSVTGQKHYNHLTILVENSQGYKNLSYLVSKSYLEGMYYRPRIDKTILRENSKGLIALSGCLLGEISELILKNNLDAAEKTAFEFKEIFGAENFFLEAQMHGLPEQRKVNEGLKHISKKCEIPIVATNDCHFPAKEDYETHKVLLAIQTGSTVKDEVLSYSEHHYFKSPKEMSEAFSDMPSALDASRLIADRCHFKFEEEVLLLPAFSVPKSEKPEDYFRQIVREGFDARLKKLRIQESAGLLKNPVSAYEKRLEHEIQTIIKMNFIGYFLIVWDFIRYAKSQNIPVGPGRGSAGGSLVSWALGITDIDPLQYGLFFERFLNPKRISLPDIDIDFCMKRREQVIKYVREKYGTDHCSQVITFGTMQARAVVRDVGRALGFPYTETDRLAKLIPHEPGMTLQKALKVVQELAQEIEDRPALKQLIKHCLKLEGLTRHASTHAAGVVIAPSPVWNYCPLYKSDKDDITTQYDKGAVERVGLLKIDFLGLRTLTVLDEAVKTIEKTEKIKLQLEELSFDDAKTYEMFTRGDTYGVFQFESSGMRDVMRRLKPSKIEDLIALNALYRPGPLQGGVVDEFIKRRHGRADVNYILPELEPVLKDTYGITVYQEQVMQIATEIAGFSPAEADLLRRAMGKKQKEVMAEQRKRFADGAHERGIQKNKAKQIFDLMEKFAGYGFNKSHSTAYAIIAYQTAYLKAHYPVHFMASVLTSFCGDLKETPKAIHECRRMGIEVVPPDINHSEYNFTVECSEDGKRRILFGLGGIKNVGEKAIESILEFRKNNGRITSLSELCAGVDTRQVNRKALESLIRAGALDSLGYKRAQLISILDEAMKTASSSRGQQHLFGGAVDGGEILRVPEIDEYSKNELLSAEREMLGFYINGNPLDEFADEIDRFATADSATLAERPDRSNQAMAGIVRKVSTKTTRKGALMAIVELEDQKGSTELLVFPDAYERLKDFLTEDKLVIVKGIADVVTEGKKAKLLVNSVSPIESLRAVKGRAVLIETSAVGLEDETLKKLNSVIREHKGKVPVYLRLNFPKRYSVKMRLNADGGVKPTSAFIDKLKSLVGEEGVKLEI